MKAPTIGELNRQVKLCSSNDRIEDGAMCIVREGVRDLYAQITPKSSGAQWSREGYSSEERATHTIITRAMPDIDVTVMAWFYEKRRISQDIWYKIMDTAESPDGQYWRFDARIQQRSDRAAPTEAKNQFHRESGVEL